MTARPLYELVVAVIDMLPVIPDGADTLLTLEQAATLPILGGQFDERSLAYAAAPSR